MSKELDEAMDAIPNLTEEQIQALIDFQLQELANYTGRRIAKKDQSEDDVQAALQLMLDEKPKVVGFKRRF